MFGADPELWLIFGMGAIWLLGLLLLLRSPRRPDSEREHYTDRTNESGVPDER